MWGNQRSIPTYKKVLLDVKLSSKHRTLTYSVNYPYLKNIAFQCVSFFLKQIYFSHNNSSLLFEVNFFLMIIKFLGNSSLFFNLYGNEFLCNNSTGQKNCSFRIIKGLLEPGGQCHPPKILADQLSLSQPGGILSPPHYYSPPNPDFQTFLRPCFFGVFKNTFVIGKCSPFGAHINYTITYDKSAHWTYHITCNSKKD